MTGRALSLILNAVINRGEKKKNPARQQRQTVFQTNLFECRQISLCPICIEQTDLISPDGRVKRAPTQLTCDSVSCESEVSLVSQSASSLAEAKWNTLYFHADAFHDISTGDKGWWSSELAVGVQFLFCQILVLNSFNSVLNVQQDMISVASTGAD